MEDYKVSICKTKNKFIIKFEINQFITNHQNYEYNNIDEATNAPLVKELFYYPFVKKVYVASNFIAIERFKLDEHSKIEDFINIAEKKLSLFFD